MTPEQIRSMGIDFSKTQYGNPLESTGVDDFKCAMLQEIAAQLAELNAHVKLESQEEKA